MAALKQVIIKRVSFTNEGVFGMCEVNYFPICNTYELPWKQNKTNISCVPPGDYIAFRRISPKRGYAVFELKDVPGRGNVQIHIGNKAKHIRGCILLGERIQRSGKDAAVLMSKIAFNEFMGLLKGVKVIQVKILNLGV